MDDYSGHLVFRLEERLAHVGAETVRGKSRLDHIGTQDPAHGGTHAESDGAGIRRLARDA